MGIGLRVVLGSVLTLVPACLAADSVVYENQTLIASPDFNGRAQIHITGASKVRIRNVVIDGRRDLLEQRLPIAENGAPFIDYYRRSGIAIDKSTDVIIEDVVLRNVANLAIVVARSSNVIIRRVTVEDSGSRDARGRNNTTGGILIEEGTSQFEIRDCRLTRIRGNAIWTHSYSASPRNRDGVIASNEIDTVGRDAIQAGHATRLRIENNVMRNVGYPVEIVDVENQGYPVGIDTAGNVDVTHYTANRMFEVNGKCFDLDGFHDGTITRNLCINSRDVAAYPNANLAVLFNDSHPESESRNITLEKNTFDGMSYGGIFVYGSGHRIAGNTFLNLNRKAYRGEPGYLRAGIYFATGLLRPNPPKGIVVEGNSISGYGMKLNCVVDAPGVSKSGYRLVRNACADAKTGPSDALH